MLTPRSGPTATESVWIVEPRQGLSEPAERAIPPPHLDTDVAGLARSLPLQDCGRPGIAADGKLLKTGTCSKQ